MRPNEVLNFVEKYKWKYFTTGNQLNVEICPSCKDDKKHFYINQVTGLWDCKKCSAKGNFTQLIGMVTGIYSLQDFDPNNDTRIPEQQLFKISHEKLLANNTAMKYLSDRGFTKETINYFQLGYQEIHSKAWLSIPYRAGGEFIGAKLRTIPPYDKTFLRLGKWESFLFNDECIDKFNAIIITESETDAMMLYQYGFKNTVSVPTGAAGSTGEWIKRLRNKRVFIVFDTDAAGVKGAERLFKNLPCSSIITLNFQDKKLKDVSDYFIKDKRTREDFEKLLANNTKEIVKVNEELEGFMGYVDGLNQQITNFSPWKNLNETIHPVEGHLVTIAAPSGVGKTTFCLNIALEMSRHTPVLFYCLEMSKYEIMERMIQATMEVTIEEARTREVATKAFNQFKYLKLYIRESDGVINLPNVINKIETAVDILGVKAVFFDNLHFLCRDTKDPRIELNRASKVFKLLAVRLKIIIFMIVQLTKNKNKHLVQSSDDIRETGAIKTDSDICIVLYRKVLATTIKDVEEGEEDAENLSPITIVNIDKNRTGKGKRIKLYFEGGHAFFREMYIAGLFAAQKRREGCND